MLDFKDYDRLVLFDGQCLLCSYSIQFICRYEKGDQLSFGYLQDFEIRKAELAESVLFYEDGVLWEEDLAVLKILKYLKWPWRGMRIFRFVPRVITRFVYRWISRNRFAIFKKKAVCIVPGERLKKRMVILGK